MTGNVSYRFVGVVCLCRCVSYCRSCVSVSNLPWWWTAGGCKRLMNAGGQLSTVRRVPWLAPLSVSCHCDFPQRCLQQSLDRIANHEVDYKTVGKDVRVLPLLSTSPIILTSPHSTTSYVNPATCDIQNSLTTPGPSVSHPTDRTSLFHILHPSCWTRNVVPGLKLFHNNTSTHGRP